MMESVVFKNGNSFAVRLVGDCKLPAGTRVREYRRGNSVIIEPVSAWPASFVETLGAVAGELPRPPRAGAGPRDPFED